MWAKLRKQKRVVLYQAMKNGPKYNIAMALGCSHPKLSGKSFVCFYNLLFLLKFFFCEAELEVGRVERRYGGGRRKNGTS